MKYFNKLLIAIACLAFSSLSMATYFDKESGLYENGFREYRPPDGRFTQPDPIGLAGGFNRRVTDANDPLRFSDPTGLINYEAQRPALRPGYRCRCTERPEIPAVGGGVLMAQRLD